MATKANVLLIGSGGVGTMATYALQTGGKADVTAVLRSNFKVVSENGFSIDSVQHGDGITGFKPTQILNQVPSAKEGQAFDFIVVTTKNIPDIRPNVADIIEPAVTPGHSVIVLLQNGLNIQVPIIERFPTNAVISGVSLIGATETSPGTVRHDDEDVSKIGVFESPKVPRDVAVAAAKKFVDIYNACGKVDCMYDEDVPFTRWRKLIYNTSYNAIATILRMDTTRMRISEHVIDNLIRPAMLEVKAAAKAAGVNLPDDICDLMIRIDPNDTYWKPSMCQDIEKGNLIEFENIVGEPMREAEKLGVATPVLKTLYGFTKALQFQIMEAKGLISPKWEKDSKYA
ncbi:unnamed protein product [Penicillium viridicatum]